MNREINVVDMVYIKPTGNVLFAGISTAEVTENATINGKPLSVGHNMLLHLSVFEEEGRALSSVTDWDSPRSMAKRANVVIGGSSSDGAFDSLFQYHNSFGKLDDADLFILNKEATKLYNKTMNNASA